MTFEPTYLQFHLAFLVPVAMFLIATGFVSRSRLDGRSMVLSAGRHSYWIGVAIITVWTVAATGLIWGALKAVGQARVTPEHEQEGLDVSEHGVETYPEFGSGEGVVADGGTTNFTEVTNDD